MGRRVNRKNTRRISKRVNRKNTLRNKTRRVNRKNTLRKKTRRVNRKNTKLFGGTEYTLADQTLSTSIRPTLTKAREQKSRNLYNKALSEFNRIKKNLDEYDYNEMMESFNRVDSILSGAGV